MDLKKIGEHIMQLRRQIEPAIQRKHEQASPRVE